MSDSFVVTAIIAAYNEVDVIGQVVADLAEQGIRVYLIDNASTDGTADAVLPFEGKGLIGVERFPPEGEETNTFQWRKLLERKVELARELESDWFIHHDADEFRESPWLGVNLLDGIRRVDALGYNAIDFQLFNFWPTHDRFEPGDDLRTQFVHYEPGKTWDASQIKCWKNVDDAVDLASTGGHEVTFPSRSVFPLRFILRHYPLRGSEHARRKILTERVPRFLEDERACGWHVQYDALQEDPGLRDSEGLAVYDPVAVRVELSLRSRAVESALAPIQARLAQGEAQIAALHEHLAEAERIRDEHSQERAAMQDQLREAHRAQGELFRERGVLQEQLAEAQRAFQKLSEERARLEEARAREATEHARREGESRVRLESVQASNAELKRRLGEVYASQSWRLTSPLRAGVDLLGMVRPKRKDETDC